MSPLRWALVAALGLLGLLWLWPGPTGAVPAQITAILRTGWAAALLLLASLATRPLRQWVGGGWTAWRRALGLASAALVAAHVLVVWRSGWGLEAIQLLTEPHLRSGATATAVLCFMTLTSFPRLLRALRLGHWRLLHRAVYAAALLVIHHIALSAHAEPWQLGLWSVALLMLLGLRVMLRS